jgi:hypothetical protein
MSIEGPCLASYSLLVCHQFCGVQGEPSKFATSSLEAKYRATVDATKETMC